MGADQPVSRIVLMRHGETVWHGENRYAGVSDIALSERGRREALLLAEWSRSAGLTGIYTSGLRRARETVEPTEAALGLRAVVDDRFRELDFGEGEGLTASEMRLRFPDRYTEFSRDPVEHHLPGGEDPVAAVARAKAALADVASGTGPQDRVLIVTHNTLIRLLLCDLLQIPLSRYRQLFPALGNVAINEVLLGEDSAALLQFNAPIGQTRIKL
jgi:probable phosphoglycerate mutase